MPPALFVAIVPPAPVVDALCRIQPPADSHVRTVAAERLHLTLRYIGRDAPDGVAQCLRDVRASPFQITVSGTGHFGTARRGLTLWAGVEPSDELLRVRSQVDAALVAAGCAPAELSFRPHITLARCKPRAPAEILDAQRRARIESSFMVSEFALYTSHPAQQGPPQYRCEQVYPLD